MRIGFEHFVGELAGLSLRLTRSKLTRESGQHDSSWDRSLPGGGTRHSGRPAAIDFYPLNERESQFELSAIWKKQSQGASTIIQKFIDVMDESIKLSGVV